MCDTVLATAAYTDSRTMLFGKNSDRQRNEAHVVEIIPRAEWKSGGIVRCQYISIPQVTTTNAILLCRPFWAWGGEMGANEFGVAIGNEAVHARIPASEHNALTGNDLIRLALERSSTAAEAVNVITDLLTQHGQGGNCGHLIPNYYNNGFMITDADEGFVLETMGKEWLVERVRTVRAISNRYSIGDPERTSPGLMSCILANGWSADVPSDYAVALANPDREHIGHAGARRARSEEYLHPKRGLLKLNDIMAALRDHGPPGVNSGEIHPKDNPHVSVCMHAGGKARGGQTTGSLVSEIRRDSAVHWTTGTGAPCLSIFKPVFLDVPLPFHGSVPSDKCDLSSLWWRHEEFHRRALFGDFPKVWSSIQEERNELERSFSARVTAVLDGGSRTDRQRTVEDCWNEAMTMEEEWAVRFCDIGQSRQLDYHGAWEEMNGIANLGLG